jgi:hypothetical protein
MTARRPIDSKNIMMLAIDLTKTSSCSPNALLPQAQFYQPAQISMTSAPTPLAYLPKCFPAAWV